MSGHLPEEANLTALTVDELFAAHHGLTGAARQRSLDEIARRLHDMTDAELEAAEARYSDWNVGGQLQTEKLTRESRRQKEREDSIAASTRKRYSAMSDGELKAEYDILVARLSSAKLLSAQREISRQMKICRAEIDERDNRIKPEPFDTAKKLKWFGQLLKKHPLQAIGLGLVAAVIVIAPFLLDLIKVTWP